MLNISEVKELMAQFDASSLKEFSFKTVDGELAFSKNDHQLVQRKRHFLLCLLQRL